ncbi:uncharacterized protein LOC115878915 [Sitophilus oryzae]|uniref:Uncharacterized protein LOC115878915 n=1 Tax=Sitophilus oryzae TaxID=7048 RepID=A0A6J2XKE3_SITOR|nr:uncharacterized protein LOC115878915 [Sitophilus oryzae]
MSKKLIFDSTSTSIVNLMCSCNLLEDLLNDKKIYKQIKRDPTNIYQKNNNDIVGKWENNQYIPTETAKRLMIRNAIPPKMYGLPKLHKVPLRPLVSCVQSPFEKLSKYLKDILSNIAYKNEYYLKDSQHFKQKLKNLKIPNGYKLISLDVASLYTSIPIDLASQIIRKKWDQIKKYTDIPQDEFIKGVETTLKSTYFTYDNKIYQQIDGCAMGASISSVVAQIVMEDLEESVLEKLDIRIPFFFRYVDNCLTAIPTDYMDRILDKFNEYNSNIKFTIEVEVESKINFLDVTIHNKNGILRTKWFTKETWSSRYLNFNSNHPMSQKKSVVIGLADRAISLSDPEYRKNATNKAKSFREKQLPK